MKYLLMDEEVTLAGKKGGQHYRSLLVISILFIVIGIWLLSFWFIDYQTKYTETLRFAFNVVTLIGGFVMIGLGVTIWKSSVI